jgi:hypothetical protein
MGAAYLTYTLLTLITFHNGHKEMVLHSGMPQVVCDKQAAEDNVNWKLFGDHDTFRNVVSVCILSGRLP